MSVTSVMAERSSEHSSVLCVCLCVSVRLCVLGAHPCLSGGVDGA